MENFKYKYLKYKKKYLALKLQKGGDWNCSKCTFENNDLLPYCEMCNTKKSNESNIFYLYTTGILDWMNHGQLFDRWNMEIRTHIINLIPNKYKVIIHHYDPLHVEPNELNIQKNILISNDKRNNRVLDSFFHNEKFPFTHELPYIILDFAHIFYYTHNKHIVKTNTIYESSEPIIEKNLYCVRFGYVGSKNDIENSPSQYKIFEVNYDGSITTYIDKMIEGVLISLNRS